LFLFFPRCFEIKLSKEFILKKKYEKKNTILDLPTQNMREKKNLITINNSMLSANDLGVEIKKIKKNEWRIDWLATI
jgi:hypothetical protein